MDYFAPQRGERAASGFSPGADPEDLNSLEDKLG